MRDCFLVTDQNRSHRTAQSFGKADGDGIQGGADLFHRISASNTCVKDPCAIHVGFQAVLVRPVTDVSELIKRVVVSSAGIGCIFYA